MSVSDPGYASYYVLLFVFIVYSKTVISFRREKTTCDHSVVSCVFGALSRKFKRMFRAKDDDDNYNNINNMCI